MTISLFEIEALQEQAGISSNLLSALQTASLDSAVSWHAAMRIPAHFGDAQRRFLQAQLRDFSSPVGAKTSHRSGWAVKVLQAYEVSFGRGNTELLIEWFSHCHGLTTFCNKMEGLLSDVPKGIVKAAIPPRLQRYEALCELLTEPDDDALDAVLLPENLQSEWDKHCWASNYWIEEDQNTWNPSIEVWCYIVGSGTRIAWETTCRNPQVSTQELDDLHAWVMSNTRYPQSDLPRPETMFLPARLRAEYEERGLIPPER